MTALFNILETGFLAGLLTTLAVMIFAALERESPFAPVNAISHIAFGDRAFHVTRAKGRFTITGTILNFIALMMWAGLQELIYWLTGWSSAMLGYAWLVALIVAVIAYVVDFYVVPKRLTPGFERVLSRRSLYFTYLVLALGLVVGALMRQPY